MSEYQTMFLSRGCRLYRYVCSKLWQTFKADAYIILSDGYIWGEPTSTDMTGIGRNHSTMPPPPPPEMTNK